MRFAETPRASRFAVVVAAALAVAACGDDGPGSSTGAMTVDEFCAGQAALEQGWCTYLDTCCVDADRAASDFLPWYCRSGSPDSTSCVTSLQAKLAAGTVRWNGDHGQECLDALAARIPAPPDACVGVAAVATGDELRAQPTVSQIAACRAAIVGRRAEGQTCNSTSECASDLSCQVVASALQCAPVSDEYGACGDDEDCVVGLHCVSDHCATLGGDGQGCQLSDDCQAGLDCDADSLCSVPGQAGNLCSSSSDCDIGLVCDYMQSPSRCANFGLDGATCTYDQECQGRCDTGSGTCVAICGGTWY